MDDEALKALKSFAAFNFIPKALLVGTLSNLINFVILSRSTQTRLSYFPIFHILLLSNSPDRASRAPQISSFRYWRSPTQFSCCWFTCSRNNTTTMFTITRSISIGGCLASAIGSIQLSVSLFSSAEQQWKLTRLLVYITVYLTLSLALDRYAAVSKPTRTQCRIARAKNVVSSKLTLFVRGLYAGYSPILLSNVLHEREYHQDKFLIRFHSGKFQRQIKF